MNDIGYKEIFYILLLVLPTLLINRSLNIDLNKKIVISIVRMTIQLSLVGLYLQYIFDLNNSILNLSYMLLMIMIAAASVIHSTGFSLKRLYAPIFISIVLPNVCMILFFNGIVVRLEHVLDARFVITIGGMLLGNVLSGDIVGLTTFYRGIAANRKRVNYDLALGATRFEATKPYLRDAIKASIMPTVASMATLGLISLPGMMTGQILGGSVPMEAIMYQIAIMIAIYVARYANIYGALLLSQKTMFNKQDQLIPDM